MYVCMYTRIYVYTYVCMYVCIFNKCLSVYYNTWSTICMYVCMYVCMYITTIYYIVTCIPFLSLSLRPRICPRMRCPTITSLAGATWGALDSVCLLSNTPIARYSPPGTSGDPSSEA
jgi:hypothetical protein